MKRGIFDPKKGKLIAKNFIGKHPFKTIALRKPLTLKNGDTLTVDYDISFKKP